MTLSPRLRPLLFTLSVLGAAALAACSTPVARPPATVVPKVDLARFMGEWFVIAHIPTFIDKGGQNQRERYRLDPDGTVATTFTFNADAPDGPLKTYHPRGFIVDATNAVWGMQFVWPIKADYRISYLADDYSVTVIGREARDLVWIMARTPTIPEADYQRLLAFVTREGYDIGKLVRVPQVAR